MRKRRGSIAVVNAPYASTYATGKIIAGLLRIACIALAPTVFFRIFSFFVNVYYGNLSLSAWTKIFF